MEGLLGELTGIPILEDKHTPEGTYICLDKDGLPIKGKDMGKVDISKIIVHNAKTFKIALSQNK